MMQRLGVVVCVFLMATSAIVAAAEIHTFRNDLGHSHTGTFQKVQDGKVHVRVRNKNLQLPFSSLLKADQLYVLNLIQSDPLTSKSLQVAEDPREWTDTRGTKTTGRFVEVRAGATVVLLIKGNSSDFPLANFSRADQDYVYSRVRGTDAEKFLPAQTQGGESPVSHSPTPLSNPVPARPGFPITIPQPFIPQPVIPQPSFPTVSPTGGSPSPSSINESAPMPAPSNPGFSGNDSSPVFNPAAGHGAPAGNSFDTSRSFPPALNPNPMTPPRSSNHSPLSNNLQGYDVYECSNCRKQVSKNDIRCPHCRVHFDYVQNPDGTTSSTSTGVVRNTGRALRVILFIVIPFCVWVCKKLVNW